MSEVVCEDFSPVFQLSEYAFDSIPILSDVLESERMKQRCAIGHKNRVVDEIFARS